MTDISAQDKFASDIAYYITSKVTGTNIDDALVKEKPHRLFLIGTLASRKRVIVDEHEEKLDEGNAASIRASKLKVSILSTKDNFEAYQKAVVKCTGNVYYKVKTEKKDATNEDSENKSDPNLWKRIDFSNEYTLNLSKDSCFEVDFSNTIQSANNDPLISKRIPENLWNANISVNLSDYNEKCSFISFGFENLSTEPDENGTEKKNDFERTLFNCKLEVKLENLKVEEFMDEYFYEGFAQRYFYDFRTINCQAKWIGDNKKHFATEHFARFEQPNVRPRETIPGINVTFSNLTSPENVIFALEEFVTQMKNHKLVYKNNIQNDMPLNSFETDFQPRKNNRQVTWEERIKLAEHFDLLISRIEKGLDLIKTEPAVQESFLKTNEAFYNYYSTQDKPILNAGWRLFQLAFFLSSIESVVKECNLDTVDVLHVDTGGGKSEAYFGLVVFTSFYERYIGIKDGVSSIVKFPLRMLSIQQLERAASIIIHAEDVRKKYEDTFPGSSFSLGYYVGSKSGEFPDLYSKVKNNLSEKNKLISPAPASKIISKCPLCPPNSKGVIRLVDDSEHKRVIHECDKCGKEYYIYLSDREIFRWRPTVIVSTVDKWASLSLQRRVRNLLGGTGSMCPNGHGFIPSGDKCEDKDDEEFQCSNIGENISSNSGPRLSIQDEMHLLKEGFGTISSHFEGLIETIVEDRTNRKLKHIAMSATLNGTKNQIKELYNKDYFVIPGRCPEGPGTQNDFFFEKKEGPKRIIYGLKPNLRDNHYASLRTLLHFAEFTINSQRNLNSNPNHFCAKYGLNDVYDAQKLLNQYLVPLTYHIKKQDAYDMGRLKDAVISDSLKENYDIFDMQGTVLTGDSDLEDLKKAIDNVRSFVREYDPKSFDKEGIVFEPIYATSVVSHGVDLDELNFMTFQGLPYSTSEYIQALSRVGRKNLGMILLWFYPNRVRDESFYRNFMRYHDSLDHEVRPVPINRNSRLGLMQTINSIFCAGIINHMSSQKGRPLYRKKDIEDLTSSEQENVVEFIEKAYGQPLLDDITISDEVQARINEIIHGKDKDTVFFPNILTNSGNPYFRTQSGMRGIQKHLTLCLKIDDEKILRRMEQ